MTAVLEQDFYLKNGMRVGFRPIFPIDTPYLVDIFHNLSPESRYQRFHQSVEGITPEQVQTRAAQTALDSYIHGFGLLAFSSDDGYPPQPLGGARYYAYDTTPDSGELAITIRDDMQGQGLGNGLLAALIVEARQRGLKQITGVALPSNRGMWRLLEKTGLPLERWYDGPDMHFTLTL